MSQTILAKLRREQNNEILGAMYPYKRTKYGIKITGKAEYDTVEHEIIAYKDSKIMKEEARRYVIGWFRSAGYTYERIGLIMNLTKQRIEQIHKSKTPSKI